MIYFVSSGRNATGGPTLLHQGCNELLRAGFKAKMLYVDIKVYDDIHPKFREYGLGYIDTWDDIVSTDIVVVPEIWFLVKKLTEKKCIKVVWWLSVDNFLVSRYYASFCGKIVKLILRLYLGNNYYRFDHINVVRNNFYIDVKRELKNIDFHFSQSFYANQFLLGHDIPSLYLGDYIEPFFNFNETFKDTNKKKLVVYNPSKGYKYLKRVKEICSDINFLQIKGLSPSEVNDLLCQACIYLDLGNHPGQDRIPREARLCGCVVLVGKRGSAINNYDVPISDEYKFDLVDGYEYLIKRTILDIFDNHSLHLSRQSPYLEYIQQQELTFKNDIVDRFKRLTEL